MSEVWVNGHYFNGRSDVDFGQPSAATHDFDQGNGLVNVLIVEKKILERNEVVNARERGIMWWWKMKDCSPKNLNSVIIYSLSRTKPVYIFYPGAEYKEDILKNVVYQTVAGPHWLW